MLKSPLRRACFAWVRRFGLGFAAGVGWILMLLGREFVVTLWIVGCGLR